MRGPSVAETIEHRMFAKKVDRRLQKCQKTGLIQVLMRQIVSDRLTAIKNGSIVRTSVRNIPF
jgi:hypothetical protein